MPVRVPGIPAVPSIPGYGIVGGGAPPPVFPAIFDKTSAIITSGATFAVPAPAGGIVDGTFMMLVVGARGASPTITVPAGFTTIVTQGRATNGRLAAYYKIASAESGDYSVTIGSPTQQQFGELLLISNVEVATPFDTPTSGTSVGTVATPPAVTTNVGRELVVRSALIALSGGTATWDWAAPDVEYDELDSTVAAMSIAQQQVLSPTTVAAGAATSPSGTSAYFSIPLRPAS